MGAVGGDLTDLQVTTRFVESTIESLKGTGEWIGLGKRIEAFATPPGRRILIPALHSLFPERGYVVYYYAQMLVWDGDNAPEHIVTEAAALSLLEIYKAVGVSGSISAPDLRALCGGISNSLLSNRIKRFGCISGTGYYSIPAGWTENTRLWVHSKKDGFFGGRLITLDQLSRPGALEIKKTSVEEALQRLQDSPGLGTVDPEEYQKLLSLLRSHLRGI